MQNSILIVDDETFNLELLKFALRELDSIEVSECMNGKDALNIVDKKKIDLIILDISMLGMDGLEVLQILKSSETSKYIPVIMVTAKKEERHKALDYGAEDFLIKPIDVLELKFKVNNLLKLKKFNDLQQHFNKRLEEEIEKKEEELKKFAHIEQELKMAKEIQESILPKAYPITSKLDIFGSCQQASDVGGDYFDVFESECGDYTYFIMADVSGHGFASSLLAMQFRTIVHAELDQYQEDFEATVKRINHIFSKANADSSMFITALMLRYSHADAMFESINAGHFNPLGNVEMNHQSGIPFGILDNAVYAVLQTKFQTGDTLLLFTDGIIEGESQSGEMYESRLYELYSQLHTLESEETVEAILKDYHQFVTRQTDDVSIMAITHGI